MRKLILKCGLSPGDIVMLTAAIRDLHRWYPGRFATDVRTVCHDLWEHNPHLTPLSEEDPEVEQIECSYPLINKCDRTPYHCLHGFIEFLNERLNLCIKPTAFKGDLHLSEQERQWYSQVHEVTGADTPFWIVAAGGKYDITIKWWESRRYQEVINAFRGRIQFVQVGNQGHHHPKLEGVIDLRGQTSLRELIRLVFHSQGVLCSVTALMHLAAAVETKGQRPTTRPCVVIGGGREPAHWEAYPQHQFIHTNGALPCCANGGCWKDRTARLRDGNERDQPNARCQNVVQGIPRCMDLITPTEVIHRIGTYFEGGVHQYLSPRQRTAAARGVRATASNPYDQQPLVLHNAGMECDRFTQAIPPYPDRYQGRGIVICAGGVRYFTNAWVCINMLRRLGCRLPIQLWYLGEREMNPRMKALVAPLGVECVDACKMRKQFPARVLHGWELKPYAIIHSPFREVLFLDADNVPVVNPAFLFATPEYQSAGAIFWPDYDHGVSDKAKVIWRSCGMRQPVEPEFETGQIVVDKQRCWAALQLCMWFNENSDFYYRYLHGDKETFHLAFRKLKKNYSLVATPIHTLAATMCQHDFQGRRIFQHRNMDKWDLLLHNRRVRDFWFEKECREYVTQLRQVWDGGMEFCGPSKPRVPGRPVRKVRAARIEAVVISHPLSNGSRPHTLENLAKTDWGEAPTLLQLEADEDHGDRRRDQIDKAARCLKKSLDRGADHILFLRGELDFNRHLRHNLHHWGPLRNGRVTLAGLYNPGIRELACDVRNNARVVAPRSAVFGSPVFLVARDVVDRFVRYWMTVEGGRDLGFARLAGKLRHPILYHAPSLVQLLGPGDAGEERPRPALDYDPGWRA